MEIMEKLWNCVFDFLWEPRYMSTLLNALYTRAIAPYIDILSMTHLKSKIFLLINILNQKK